MATSSGGRGQTRGGEEVMEGGGETMVSRGCLRGRAGVTGAGVED